MMHTPFKDEINPGVELLAVHGRRRFFRKSPKSEREYGTKTHEHHRSSRPEQNHRHFAGLEASRLFQRLRHMARRRLQADGDAGRASLRRKKSPGKMLVLTSKNVTSRSPSNRLPGAVIDGQRGGKGAESVLSRRKIDVVKSLCVAFALASVCQASRGLRTAPMARCVNTYR